jgi:hypothetical protein
VLLLERAGLTTLEFNGTRDRDHPELLKENLPEIEGFARVRVVLALITVSAEEICTGPPLTSL